MNPERGGYKLKREQIIQDKGLSLPPVVERVPPQPVRAMEHPEPLVSDRLSARPKPVEPPTPGAPSPIPPKVEKSYSGQYADEQGIRQRYEELLAEQAKLKSKLTSWTSIFQRGNIRVSLDLVQRSIQRYEEKFSFVTEPRDLIQPKDRRIEQNYQTDRIAKATQPSERQDALNKIIALERADASLQLDHQDQLGKAKLRTHVMEPKDYRLSSTAAIQKLNQLLQQAPKNWKAYQTWKIQAAAAEAYLPNLFSLGSAEQHQVTDYWAKKIFMLEQVRPLVFGRSDWQTEYEQAYTARRAAISQGLKRRAS